MVRAAGDPAAMGQTVRLALEELEPQRAVYELAPLADRVEGAFAPPRWCPRRRRRRSNR